MSESNNPFARNTGWAVDQAGYVEDWFPVPPGSFSDTVNNVGPGNVAIGIHSEVAGLLRVLTAAGTTREVNVPDGYDMICGVQRVLTGTTAEGIHALIANGRY